MWKYPLTIHFIFTLLMWFWALIEFSSSSLLILGAWFIISSVSWLWFIVQDIKAQESQI